MMEFDDDFMEGVSIVNALQLIQERGGNASDYWNQESFIPAQR